MKYYIQDTTLRTEPILFESVRDVVKHLEGTVQRKFNLTREQYMNNLIDLGYGYDDDGGITFTQSLSEYFSIGVVRNDRLVKTNIHETDKYARYTNEMGN